MDFIIARLEKWLWSDERGSGAPPRWLTVARYAFALGRDFARGELSLRAMSLVYSTMWAVAPLLAFSFSVLKGLGFHRQLEPFLAKLLAPLGPRADELTARVITFVDNVSGSTLAGVAVVLLLYTVLSTAQKVESSFNYVWRVDRPRSFARRFSEYLSVILIGPLVITVAMGFTATLSSTALVTWISGIEPFGTWLTRLGTLMPYVLVTGLFSFLYIFIPNTRVQFKSALVGGLFAGVLWAGSGSLFAEFVVSSARNWAIYAGFAIVLVTMLWIYTSWLILLLGAQLAFYLQNPDYLRLGQRTQTLSSGLTERLALGSMLLVGRDFEQPGHGWRAESVAARIGVPRHFVEPVLTSLTTAGLLTQTAEQRLIPARDPRRITVMEILAAVRHPGDALGAAGADWNETLRTLTDSVEHGIRDALADRSLADIVAADIEAERTAADATALAASGPRAISRRG
jgi:membrane protein